MSTTNPSQLGRFLGEFTNGEERFGFEENSQGRMDFLK